MTISAMRTKYVVLGLAMCLFLSGFHEVSCQVGGKDAMANLIKDFESQGGAGRGKTSDAHFEAEGESITKESKRKSNETKFEAGSSSFQQSGSADFQESGSAESCSSSDFIDSTGRGAYWRCSLPNQSGGKDEDTLVIPKYEIDTIIREESSYQGSSKTASFLTSLEKILEEHRKGMVSKNIDFGIVTSTSTSATKETSAEIESIKVYLKKFQSMKISELVTHSEFTHILTMVRRYEQLTKATVSYVSKLERYASVIKEGFRATKQIQTMTQRVEEHKTRATVHQEKVDAMYEEVKTVAKKGDELRVKIYAMKKLVLTLEGEQEEVDLEFKKVVGRLSRVLAESRKVYETYHEVHKEWTSYQASAEYSTETTEKAETVWAQFCSTLD